MSTGAAGLIDEQSLTGGEVPVYQLAIDNADLIR